VRDLIYAAQTISHHLPDGGRRHFAVVGFEGFLFHLVDDSQQFALRHGTLEAGALEPGENLGAIPRNAPAVFLHDDQPHGIFDAFVGGKSLGADETLAAPADRAPAFACSRVDDLQAFLLRVAEGTVHEMEKLPVLSGKSKTRPATRKALPLWC